MGITWDEMMLRRYADPVIAFANLPGIAHVDDVHRLFAPAVISSQAVLSGQPVMQVLEVGNEAAFERDRQRVHKWLEILSRPRLSARARKEVQRDVESLMDRTIAFKLSGSARFEDGVLAVSVSPVLTGVEGVIAFAMALLVDDAEQRWKRLGRCELRGCGAFFLRQPGRRQEFCQPSHSMKKRDQKRGQRRRTGRES